jgi:ABC-2 type transport system ATP-binding protein
VLDVVGLTGRSDTRVRTWSTGMRQRLGLAAALLRRPRLLLLEEPTSGLDAAGVADVHQMLRKLAAEGTAVLLSSHDKAEVLALCTSATVLSQGRVRFTGALDVLPGTAAGAELLLSTTDDVAAAAIAASVDQVTVHVGPDGLHVSGPLPAVDTLMIELGRGGVAVRRLVPRETALDRALTGYAE